MPINLINFLSSFIAPVWPKGKESLMKVNQALLLDFHNSFGQYSENEILNFLSVCGAKCIWENAVQQ